MMKYNKQAHTVLRSRDPTDIFFKRILDMMRDYDISLAEALYWDMDGFMPYHDRKIMLTVKEDIDYYFYTNYLPKSSKAFFSGVMLGEYPDYGLTDEEETEQKDTGSSGTP